MGTQKKGRRSCPFCLLNSPVLYWLSSSLSFSRSSPTGRLKRHRSSSPAHKQTRPKRSFYFLAPARSPSGQPSPLSPFLLNTNKRVPLHRLKDTRTAHTPPCSLSLAFRSQSSSPDTLPESPTCHPSMTRADDPYSSAPASSSSFSHSPSQSSLYPAGQHDNDADSFYSQSPGRPNMYHDPSAPVLARPATGGARASFETSGTYDAPSSPQRTGGGIAGSPFNDEDDSGSFMRPRKNAGGATPRGTSIFDSVYNASNSRCVRTSPCHPPFRSSPSPLRCPRLT